MATTYPENPVPVHGSAEISGGEFGTLTITCDVEDTWNVNGPDDVSWIIRAGAEGTYTVVDVDGRVEGVPRHYPSWRDLMVTYF